MTCIFLVPLIMLGVGFFIYLLVDFVRDMRSTNREWREELHDFKD